MKEWDSVLVVVLMVTAVLKKNVNRVVNRLFVSCHLVCFIYYFSMVSM